MFQQAFKTIDDILSKDASFTNDQHYVTQSFWGILLKYLNVLDADKTTDGRFDQRVVLTVRDLLDFVNSRMLLQVQ